MTYLFTMLTILRKLEYCGTFGVAWVFDLIFVAYLWDDIFSISWVELKPERKTCWLICFLYAHHSISQQRLDQRFYIQVNLSHKLLFLHQLTHNMMIDCSLNYKFNTWKFQAQNMGRTCCVQKLIWMSEKNSVRNMFSPGLSLEFSCIELVIQWTICHHIVG